MEYNFKIGDRVNVNEPWDRGIVSGVVTRFGCNSNFLWVDGRPYNLRYIRLARGYEVYPSQFDADELEICENPTGPEKMAFINTNLALSRMKHG